MTEHVKFEILVGASSAEIAGSARLSTGRAGTSTATGRVNFIQD